MDRNDFLQFLDSGVTSAHVAANIVRALESAGYVHRSTADDWSTLPGAFFTTVDASVVAVRLGGSKQVQDGAVIVAAHSDSPALQLKARSATAVDGLLRVPVEVYGSPIVSSWLDRDLLVAGRVVIRQKNASHTLQLFRTDGPAAVIPNAAIHLNKEVNNGFTYNRHDHLQAIFGLAAPSDDANAQEVLLNFVASHAGCDADQIVDAELFLVPSQEAAVLSGEMDLIAAPRIDNLAGTFSNLFAFLGGSPDLSDGTTRIAVFYDHEEIGSRTMSGADGGMVESILRRIAGSREMFERMVARSVLVSNDGAHARHPSYPAKHDDGYAPRIGGGPVIKKSAVRRYSTDVRTAAWFAGACQSSSIPVQYLQNRGDIPAGSTIGPLQSARLGISAIDVGIPMLAMHSARELVSFRDVCAMTTALETLFKRGNDEIAVFDSSRKS